jgi:hypothetical protein
MAKYILDRSEELGLLKPDAPYIVVIFFLDSQGGVPYSPSPRSKFLSPEVVRREGEKELHRADLSCGISRVEQVGDSWTHHRLNNFCSLTLKNNKIKRR